MKRRLVIASVATALLAGGAGAASATTDKRTSDPARSLHQLCLLLYGDRGGIPDKLCLNW